MINKHIETILTKLTRLTKLKTNSDNNVSYEVLSLPDSINLLELTVNDDRYRKERDANYPCSSSDELISIASPKKKGFTLTSGANYEDIVKAIFACPSSFFF